MGKSIRICKSDGVDWVTDYGYYRQSGWLSPSRKDKRVMESDTSLDRYINLIIEKYEVHDSRGTFEYAIKALINQEKIKELEEIKQYPHLLYNSGGRPDEYGIPEQIIDDRITQIKEGKGK